MIRYGILSVPNDFLDRFQTREVVRNDLGHDSDDITREIFLVREGVSTHRGHVPPPSPLEGEGGTPCVRVRPLSEETVSKISRFPTVINQGSQVWYKIKKSFSA